MNARTLGYDPRAHLTHWRGTPIPALDNPVPATPLREAIAREIWWNGPPWTVLRNNAAFVLQIMDYANAPRIAQALKDLEPWRWRDAIEGAQPGTVSKGAYVLFSMRFALLEPEGRCEWPHANHRNDIAPLSAHERQALYNRQLRAQQRRTDNGRAAPNVVPIRAARIPREGNTR